MRLSFIFGKVYFIFLRYLSLLKENNTKNLEKSLFQIKSIATQ
jgi:hypothetical protein